MEASGVFLYQAAKRVVATRQVTGVHIYLRMSVAA
jgi:hypothetical protein